MIDDTLKEIRFVFNVGLLHSPYVSIYQKRTTTSIQSSNTHIHTRESKRDENIYVKVPKAVKEEGVIYANMYCNMKSYKCILTTSPLLYKFWYFRKKSYVVPKRKKRNWHNSLKLRFLFQWSFNKMKTVHMCLSNVSWH